MLSTCGLLEAFFKVLKELAMGEYSMPVVGMPSVFDLSEMQGSDKTWAGREWFVVKKAEVRMAEDSK